MCYHALVLFAHKWGTSEVSKKVLYVFVAQGGAKLWALKVRPAGYRTRASRRPAITIENREKVASNPKCQLFSFDHKL
jgi:hypothetical protein